MKNIEVEYRNQGANIRSFHEEKDSEGASTGKVKMKKTLKAGYMASRGRWSAWGADQALALDNLDKIEPSFLSIR